MGLLDRLGIGGTKDEREARAVAKLQKKTVEKYGPPENRQGAIEELGEMRTARATRSASNRASPTTRRSSASWRSSTRPAPRSPSPS